MQISKKRELSRKSELKEYCGMGTVVRPQILAGAESVAWVLGTIGGEPHWNEMYR